MKLLQARPAEGDPSLLLKESSLCAGGASITSPLYLYYQLNAQYCRNLCVSLAGDNLDIRSQVLKVLVPSVHLAPKSRNQDSSLAADLTPSWTNDDGMKNSALLQL